MHCAPRSDGQFLNYFDLLVSPSGLTLGVLIFLVCANYTASPSLDASVPSASKWDSGRPAAAAAVSGKRLHNLAGESLTEALGDDDDDLRAPAAVAAHLPSNRGVKFIALDPSKPRKGLPSPKPRVSDDEVEYYKAKNQ